MSDTKVCDWRGPFGMTCSLPAGHPDKLLAVVPPDPAPLPLPAPLPTKEP